MSATITDLIVTGSYRQTSGTFYVPNSPSGEWPVANLALRSARIYPVKLTDLVVHDAPQTRLPGTSAADDLGLYGATFGTDSMYAATYDVKAAGSLTLRARCQMYLPAEYEAAAGVVIRCRAGMKTTAADVACTLDVEAYRSDGEGGIGSDLCATSATSMNQTTDADRDFTITPATLSAGDVLDVRFTIAVNDAATLTAVIAVIGKIALVCSTRG